MSVARGRGNHSDPYLSVIHVFQHSQHLCQMVLKYLNIFPLEGDIMTLNSLFFLASRDFCLLMALVN